jgi:hypothetical protein
MIDKSSYSDQSFDVIVLEFHDKYFFATIQLAKRLRQRFPNALILVLDVCGSY